MTKYIIATLLVLSVAVNTFAEPSGAAFLKIPNGAAEISLGMSGVSHSTGGSAAFWNPARIGLGGHALGLQFFRWLGDGRGMFGSAAFETTWGGVAAYLFDLSIDEFEARDRPGPPDATFTLHQSVVGLGLAFKIPFDIRAGASVKGYIEDIYGDVAAQFPLLDLGLAWSSGAWAAGLSGANLTIHDRIDYPPPTTLRIGISRRDYLGDYSLADVVEASFVRDLRSTLHLGVEAGFRKMFLLRGGASISEDQVRPTFGLGIRTGPYWIDAAMALYDEAIGSTWRIGLGYRL